MLLAGQKHGRGGQRGRQSHAPSQSRREVGCDCTRVSRRARGALLEGEIVVGDRTDTEDAEPEAPLTRRVLDEDGRG